MNQNEILFFDKALQRADELQGACRKFEIARAAIEALETNDAGLYIRVMSIDNEVGYTIPDLPQNVEDGIKTVLLSHFNTQISNARKVVLKQAFPPEDMEAVREKLNVVFDTPTTVNTLAETFANAMNRKMQEALEEVKTEEPSTAAEEAPSTAEDDPTKLVPPPMAAEKVTNEEIMELASQGLTAKQIADKTGMKANTVCHRIAYMNDKNKREQGIEKPAPKPRAYTRDVISDEELEEQYFKRGLTIKAIAEKLGINPSSLYKRIEAMRDKRFKIAKECVSSKQS